MGNFSRDTFDPTKNYVGVRLQQGVPLVDADWNELNDIRRHELYDGMNLALPDGMSPGSAVLSVFPDPKNSENGIGSWPGSGLIHGRPLHVNANDTFYFLGFPIPYFSYNTQPWRDPARATQDGVDVIPDLTTPAADRTDIVFIDVWEREVDSDEDSNLINPAIGIETSIRTKREAALRVEEGTDTLPSAPQGHYFMPLALLNRVAGDPKIQSEQVVDIRPFLHATQGVREVSFMPAFQPLYFSGDLPRWKLFTGYGTKKIAAGNNGDMVGPIIGILPLYFPDGARLSHLIIAGNLNNFSLQLQLVRIHHASFESLSEANELHDMLFDSTLPSSTGKFARTFLLPESNRMNIVNNNRYYYGLFAEATSTGTSSRHAIIDGISFRYNY